MDKFIADVFAHCGVRLSPSQVKLFTTYENELLIWNEKFNLTAIRDSEGIAPNSSIC
jgi:16S rRNA (guanine527-N7)-methyltransferase